MARGKAKPGSSAARAAAEAERQGRLAAALRENLRKRKAQKRGLGEAARDLDPGQPREPERQPLEDKRQVK